MEREEAIRLKDEIYAGKDLPRPIRSKIVSVGLANIESRADDFEVTIGLASPATAEDILPYIPEDRRKEIRFVSFGEQPQAH